MPTTTATRLWVEATHEAVERMSFQGGEAACFSMPRPGRSGPNEDAAALLAVGANAGVLAVADGAGGQSAGATASRTAVELLRDEVVCEDPRSVRERILDGIEAANRNLLAKGLGSATTLVALELDEGPVEGGGTARRVRGYTVGDSQFLHLKRDGTIQALSFPHSPVGYATRSGLIEEEAAMQHLDRHLVSNVIGLDGMTVEVGSAERLDPGDTLLCASDGLFDNLPTAEIVVRLAGSPLLEATAALVQACVDRMLSGAGTAPSKPDDLTVLTYRAGDAAS